MISCEIITPMSVLTSWTNMTRSPRKTPAENWVWLNGRTVHMHTIRFCSHVLSTSIFYERQIQSFLKDRMDVQPILSIKMCITINTMLKFWYDFDGHNDGDLTCKHAFNTTTTTSRNAQHEYVNMKTKIFHNALAFFRLIAFCRLTIHT